MKNFIGFVEALELTVSSVPTVGTESLALDRLTGRISSEDVVSRVDCPSVDSSLKDGYAVVSNDIKEASGENLISLKVTGQVSAGSLSKLAITNGQAIEITTGAPIPKGATAVLSREFCHRRDDEICCFNRAEPGRNIFRKGTDIRAGETIASKDEVLSPALIGLLASAGLEKIRVYKSPRVAVIATGDEVVAPGTPLKEGKLYASNMVEICSWLSLFGFSFQTKLAPDSAEKIASTIIEQLPHVDAFITSGGAWGSERDLIIRVLESLNWRGVYHRVRMGPGKAVGFGLLEKKPFFCLPGGPPSSEMAFLQLALPGLLAMKGYRQPPFPSVAARLAESVKGDEDWTQFVHARIVGGKDAIMVRPAKQKSRLQSMARKDALIVIPEGCEALSRGEVIQIQLLIPLSPCLGISPLRQKEDK
ncbi:MAG: molybdopterin molybdotransferase MoeA [Deltaproteobacteria bacterium]|nr:MAG: molybdopterin molybdotransferase MoeA [Deltaproteobacteria bacterium]